MAEMHCLFGFLTGVRGTEELGLSEGWDLHNIRKLSEEVCVEEHEWKTTAATSPLQN